MKILILSLFVIFFSNQSFGQKTDRQFRYLSIEDGLSQNMITSICQDHKGLMWFGTRDGLNCYDGYSFKVFKVDVQSSHSLTDNYITSVFEDKNGNLWIGTMHGGLLYYQREEARFLKVNITGLPAATQYVSTVSADTQGNLIATYLSGHVVKIQTPARPWTEKSTFPAEVITVLPSNELQVPFQMFITKENTLWLNGTRGFKIFSLDNLQERNFSNLNIPTYVIGYRSDQPLAPKQNDALSPLLNDTQEIREDEDGHIWMTSSLGLYHFDPKLQKFLLYQFAKNTTSLLPVHSLDGAKEIWVGTLEKGLAALRPSNKSVTYQPQIAFGQDPVKDMLIRIMCKGREGTIWLGTNGRGLFSYSPNYNLFSKVTPHSNNLVSNSIYALRPVNNSAKGMLYSTLNELVQVEEISGDTRELIIDKSLVVRSMSADKDGYIWMGNQSGLYKYNPQTQKATRILTDQGMILSVYVAPDKTIWFTTHTAICSYNQDTGKIIKTPFFSELTNRLETILYSTIQPDIDGTLWIGTTNGLFLFDPGKFEFTHVYKHNPDDPQSISSNEVKVILPDPVNPQQYIWIGTPVGLNRLDKKNGKFVHYTSKHGLPNNTIYGILADEQNNLWLSTNHGLSVFDTQKNTFMNFDVKNGLQSNEFNTGAYYKSSSGEMFFGGINGYNRFFPREAIVPQYDAPIVISDIHLIGGSNNDEYYFSENSPNELHYKQNNISIALAALDYSNTSRIQYAYRIANRDTNWVAMGTNRNVALTNLSPGKYLFQARGTDGFGRWGNQVVEMAFEINPPWWNSNWARLFYVFLGIGILYIFWRRYKKRVEEEQRIKFERQQAMAVLELEKVKAKFLANITHEFRTPLTLINGHIERLKEEILASNITIQLTEMEHNSNHLLRLINQLMDLSKIESGKYPVRYAHRNLLSDLRTGVLSFHSLAEQNKIQLNLRISPETENVLESSNLIYDENILLTIINNLLSNACKFTPQGGNINIDFYLESESSKMWLTVSDTGMGISPDELPRIFDRFYQVDTKLVRQYEGSGIGLSLVKELSVLHGGDVWVESIPGKGTTFKVCLLQGELNDIHHSINSEDETIFPENQSINVVQVTENEELPLLLVIDDHPDLRNFIQDTLGNTYRFLTSQNGKEALVLAQQFIPDLVISDVMMPEMDGYEFCRHLKQHELTSHIPVILLTARVSQEDKLTGLRQGADEYLTKPFSTAELRLRVHNMITVRKLWQGKQTRLISEMPETSVVLPGQDSYIMRIKHVIDQHISNQQFGVEQLAEAMHLSVSQLQRKLKAISGQSPLLLIQQTRMEKALEMLRLEHESIGEVAYLVGFEDQSYFTKVFKKHFGFLPSEKDKIKAFNKR